MGVAIESGGGGGGRKSVDVELNLVPFIDMMSCLVAFLLITAVWTNLAQIPIKPKGLAASGATAPTTEQLCVLVTKDAIWIGRAESGERRRIDGQDFDALGAALREERADPSLADRRDVEIAGDDGVVFQSLVSVMDLAIASGWDDVRIVDPPGLAVQFRQ
jgi:biopolymer transport protein ExbD